MKPAPFEYIRPESLAQVGELPAADEAREPSPTSEIHPDCTLLHCGLD
jgi:hypothetical protein